MRKFMEEEIEALTELVEDYRLFGKLAKISEESANNWGVFQPLKRKFLTKSRLRRRAQLRFLRKMIPVLFRIQCEIIKQQQTIRREVTRLS